MDKSKSWLHNGPQHLHLKNMAVCSLQKNVQHTYATFGIIQGNIGISRCLKNLRRYVQSFVKYQMKYVKSLEDIMTGCAEVSEMESQSWQAAFLPSEEVC